ncbi:MAG: hypothetical protein ACHQ50_05870 [Fimbriimonadales bacterium]
MKKLIVVFAVLASATACLADTVWYGGDLSVGGMTSEAGYGRVWDNFQWNSSEDLAGVFGTFLTNFTPDLASVTIREGVSEGNGGTVVYDANNLSLSSTFLGNLAGLNVYSVDADLGSLSLVDGQTYWLSIGLNVGILDEATVFDTDGANSVGSPVDDGNAFVSWPGFNFVNTVTAGGNARYHDFSYGVRGAPRDVSTPEPFTMGLGLAGVGLFVRRRMKRRGTR